MAYFLDYSTIVVTPGELTFVAELPDTITIDAKPTLPRLTSQIIGEAYVTVDGSPSLPALQSSIIGEEVQTKTVLSGIFENTVTVSAGQMVVSILPRAKFIYPKFGASAELFVPQKVRDTNLYYPSYSLKASGGQFPPEFTDVSFTPLVNVTARVVPDFEVVDPPPFLFGTYSFASFSAASRVSVFDNANGEVEYPKFGVSGTGGYPLEIESGYSYPNYQVAFRFRNLKEVEATWQYPFFAADADIDGRYNAESIVVYPTFGTDGLAVQAYIDSGDLLYPSYEVSGESQFAYSTTDNLVYPSFSVEGFGVKGVGGIVFADYPAYTAAGTLNDFSYSMDDEFTYPSFGVEASGAQNEYIPSETAIVYPSLEVNVRAGGPGDFFIEYSYPSFTASGESLFSYSQNDNVSYPVFGASGEVNVPQFGYAEWSYPVYEVNGEVPFAYIDNGFTYPQFETDGFVGPVGATLTTVVYPVFETEIEAFVFDGLRGAIEYPMLYTMGGELKTGKLVNIAIEYPAFGVAGNIKAPVGVFSELLYPTGYSVTGDIHAPVGAISEAIYPSTYGVNGWLAYVAKVNAPIVYPMGYVTDGLVEYTTSADTIIRYPLYRFDLFSAFIPRGTGNWNYPKFGTAIEIDSYYGANMDFDVIDIDLDIDGDTQHSRRQVFVIEH